MKNFVTLTAIVLCCAVVSVYAEISVSLPYETVSVTRGATSAEFSGAELFGAPGQPFLPVYNCAILLPPDADLATVTFSIKGLHEETISNYIVRPALPPMSINGPLWPVNRSIVDGRDISVYSQNAILPKQHVEVFSNGRLRCYKVVEVQVNLARYNPVTRELFRMKAGKLVVDWKKESSYSRSRSRAVLVPESSRKRVKSLVVNYDEYADAYNNDFTFLQESRVVLVTTSAVKSGLQKFDDLIASKTLRGIDVEVALESDWGGTASSLRTWLQENYEEKGWEYLFIIGHYKDHVPMMDFPGYAGSSSCPSDWAFAQLDGSDFKSDKTCELHYGRIPVYSNNYSEVDAIIEKIIEFESANKDEILWRKNALFMGPGYNSGSNRACVPLNAAHDNFVETTPGWTSYRMYGDRWGAPDGDFDENVGSGSGAISKNVAKWAEGPFGVIDWATHGSPGSAQDVIASGNTSSVGNKYPGFVLCGSCSNASPGSSTNLSWSLLKNCALGAIGGTDLTYYGGNYLTSGSDNGWAYKFAKFYIADSMTAGEALTALREMAPNYGWNNRAPYVHYGDPTIGIYTCNISPFVAVMSPNGTEKWEQGRSFDIVWSANFEDNVKVELLKGGAVDKELAASVSPEGPLIWDIPADFPLGTDYKIRVTCVVQDTLIDESDEAFAIEKKSELVLSTPNGGDYLEKDTEVEVEWTSNVGGNVRLDLVREDVVYVNIVETVPDNGSYKWNISETIPSGSTYKVRITSIDKDWLYDESDADIAIQNPLVKQFPYVQDFDDFEETTIIFRDYWEQLDDDDLDWTVWTGKTPTKEDDQGAATGPDNDHTSGSGNYLYVESSGSNNPDKKANFITPVFDLRNLEKGTCTFWYHMFSDNEGKDEMGDLYVDMSINGIWEEGVHHFSGDLGDVWKTETIDLTDCHRKKVQFRFRAVTGSGWASDICIDDFSIDGQTSISVAGVKIPSSVNLRANGSRIFYQIPESIARKQVSIKLFNIQGKLIRTLVNGNVAAGYYSVELDRADNGTSQIAAGLYLCRMQAKGFIKTIKVSIGR